jgi:6-phosphogluconolactonase
MKRKLLISLIVVLVLSLVPGISSAKKRFRVGAVYVMTNSDVENKVVVFNRDAQGILTPAGSYATGGLGSGGGVIDPLGSQGSLILTKGNRWLIAVNAGSNEISVFRVRRDTLTLADKVDSGGIFPSSLTFHRRLLYVLNADPDGGNPNITGFILNRDGTLTPVADSTRSLNSGTYSQVGFSSHGRELILTERGLNEIYVFAIRKDGLPEQAPVISPSSGAGPFGFIFDKRNHLVVSEAGSGAVSSYTVQNNGSLAIITPSVANNQNATCWIAANKKGFAYTANTASDTISSYKINTRDGSLSLIEEIAETGNGGPIDLSISSNNLFLYILNSSTGTVGMFRINNRDGSLTELGTPIGHPDLPAPFAQGIAAR